MGWTQTDIGDAGVTPFAPTDPNYAAHTYMSRDGSPSFLYSQNAGNSWTDATSLLLSAFGSDKAVSFPPIAVSPGSGTTDKTLLGGHKVYQQTTPGGAWSAKSVDLTGKCTEPATGNSICGLQDIEFSASVHLWTLSTAGGGVGAKVFCNGNFDNGGSFNNVTSDFLTSSVQPTGLTVTLANYKTAYVTTFAPAGSNTPVNTIFKTTSGCLTGANGWTALTGPTYNCEYLSVLRLLVDSGDPTGNTLLAGTDIGLFRSTDGGATWSDYGMGVVPRVPVTDIEQNSEYAIAIATHGAGAYEMSPPIFVGSQDVESECPNGTSSPCSLDISTPPGAAPGDVMVLLLDAAGPAAAPTAPSGWSIMPIANQGNAQSITATDSCSNQETEWILTHVLQQSDPSSFTFTVPLQQYNTCFGAALGEFGGILAAYRMANQNISAYTVYGYPGTTDSKTVTIGPITPAAGTAVLAFFRASADDTSNENTEAVTFSAPSGSPALTAETPLKVTGDTLTGFAADLWAGPNSSGNFGAYSSTASSSGLVMGWLIEIPAQ